LVFSGSENACVDATQAFFRFRGVHKANGWAIQRSQMRAARILAHWIPVLTRFLGANWFPPHSKTL
jgi:hypothetical protein